MRESERALHAKLKSNKIAIDKGGWAKLGRQERGVRKKRGEGKRGGGLLARKASVAVLSGGGRRVVEMLRMMFEMFDFIGVFITKCK